MTTITHQQATVTPNPIQPTPSYKRHLGLAMKEKVTSKVNLANPGVLLRIWLKQGKEKRLLARILEILEKARERLSRQNSTKKCVKVVRYSNTCMCLTEILVFLSISGSKLISINLSKIRCSVPISAEEGPHFTQS